MFFPETQTAKNSVNHYINKREEHSRYSKSVESHIDYIAQHLDGGVTAAACPSPRSSPNRGLATYTLEDAAIMTVQLNKCVYS